MHNLIHLDICICLCNYHHSKDSVTVNASLLTININSNKELSCGGQAPVDHPNEHINKVQGCGDWDTERVSKSGQKLKRICYRKNEWHWDVFKWLWPKVPLTPETQLW